MPKIPSTKKIHPASLSPEASPVHPNKVGDTKTVHRVSALWDRLKPVNTHYLFITKNLSAHNTFGISIAITGVLSAYISVASSPVAFLDSHPSTFSKLAKLMAASHAQAAPFSARSQSKTRRDLLSQANRTPATKTDVLAVSYTNLMPTNKDVISQVVNQYGTIVPEKDVPDIYQFLLEVFNDLGKAQEQLMEGAKASVNFVHIVQSKQLNAFVHKEETTGVRLQSNHLFITTGLIEAMSTELRDLGVVKGTLENLNENLFRNEMMKDANILTSVRLAKRRLSGVMAHELGHSTSGVVMSDAGREDGIYIQDHWGTQGDQAQEVMADATAVRILSKAGYSPDNILIALEKLFASEISHQSTGLQAAASTHPDSDFRLSSLRIYLTLDRLENGLPLEVKKIRANANTTFGALKDLDKLSLRKGRYPYVAPKSVAEIARRIDALQNDTQLTEEFKDLEFNRLLLSLDQVVTKYDKTQKPISPENAKEIAKAYVVAAEIYEAAYSDAFSIATPKNIRNVININTGVSGFEKAKSHVTFTRTSATFAKSISPIVLQLLKEKYSPEDWKMDPEIRVILTVQPFLTVEDFMSTYGESLAQVTTRILTEENRDSFQFERLKDLFQNDYFKSNPLFISKFFKRLMSAHIDFQRDPKTFNALFSETLKIWSPFILLDSPKDVSAVKPDRHFQMLFRQAKILAKRKNDPTAQEYLSALHETAQTIWDLRGFYGASEMLFRYSIFNWRLIFEVLDLNEGVAKNQIEASVQQYVKGKTDFHGKVAPFAELALGVSMGRRSYDRLGIEKHLIWNTHNLFAEIDKRSETPMVAARALVKQKAMFAKYFETSLTKKLREPVAGQPLDVDNFVADINTHFNNLAASDEIFLEAIDYDREIFLKAYLNVMHDTKIPLELRQAWFRQMFFDIPIQTKSGVKLDETAISTKTNFDNTSGFIGRSDTALRVVNTYRALFGRDSLEFLKEFKKAALLKNINDQVLYGCADALSDELEKDFVARKVTGFAEVLDITKILHPMVHRKVSYEKSITEEDAMTPEILADSNTFQMNSGRIQKFKKKLTETALTFNPTDEQKLTLFWEITETGASKYTDELLTVPMHIEKPSKRNRNTFVKALEEGRISSNTTRLNLTKFILEDELEVLHDHIPVNRVLLKLLIDRINLYCPTGSLAKDDYLESIGWKLSLKGSELDGYIEDQKSLNWRKANPMMIRIGSLMAVHIKRMKIHERYNWIEYLLDPVKNGTTLFDVIANDLKKIVYNDLIKNASGVLTNKALEELRVQADRIADALKVKAEAAIRESSPTERIPLFEVVLTSGEDALMKQYDWPFNITRKFLKYEPGSKEEVSFKNLLKILPRHEPSVAMAYMLALSTDPKKKSAAQLFELFDTVGIKFGQASSTFQIFGPDVAEDSEHLKSNARPLTRQEDISLAYRRAPQLIDLIADFVKQLGSASVKSSNLVKLKDGRLVVLALRREKVVEKIKMNLKMGRKFLELQKDENVIQNTKFLAAMVDALGEQLTDEIDFIKEAAKYKIVKRLVKEIERDMQDDLKVQNHSGAKDEPTHWKLEVPDVIEDLPLKSDIATYSLASTDTFDKFPESLKQEIGPMIAKFNLRMLYRSGYFDPDRHNGNFMVNRETKTIYFLDAGQLENFEESSNPFKRDPRVILAEFLMAVKNKDQTGTINAAILMNKVANDQFDRAALTEKIRKIYKTPHQGDTRAVLREVVTEIVEAGIKLDTRFMFGALKGLMVLGGEKYVGPRVFEDIMKSEITRLTIKKAPLFITTWLRNKFGNILANIKEGIANVDATPGGKGAKFSSAVTATSLTLPQNQDEKQNPVQSSAQEAGPSCEDIVAK